MNPQGKLAVIPARGGSKRIPRKNIRPFLGQPILKYPIMHAQLSEYFDEIMVSTDDQEIASLATKYGANVPFLRSPETSTDIAMTAEVVEEVIRKYEQCGRRFEYICCIYPTAPFATASRLCQAFDMLEASDADAAVPVVRFSYPIQRALRLRNQSIEMMWPQNKNVRSQDLEPAFHDAGQFYWLRVSSFLFHRTLFMPKTLALEISEIEAQDIDNEVDWTIAEIKYELLTSKAN